MKKKRKKKEEEEEEEEEEKKNSSNDVIISMFTVFLVSMDTSSEPISMKGSFRVLY
jgi:hypothetical protein